MPGKAAGVFRNSLFRWFIASQTLVLSADVALTLALGVWIEALTGSSAAAGAVFLFFAIPTVLGPLAAPLIDQFPRRNVLIGTNIALAVPILGLLAVSDAADLWIIYTVATLYGAGQQVVFAARSSLVPNLVDDTVLQKANGALESLRQGLRVIGPVAGTALYVTFGGPGLSISVAVTLIASAALLLRIPRDTVAFETRPQIRKQFTRGFHSFWSVPDLRRLIIVYSVTFGAAGLLEVSMFALVTEGLDRPASFAGVLAAVQGIGSLIAGLVVGALVKWVGPLGVQILSLTAVFAGLTLTALPVGTAVISCAFALVGIGLVGFLVHYISVIQQRLPSAEHATAFLAAEAIGNLPFVVSLIAAASLLNIFHYRALLMTGSIAMAVVIIWVSFTSKGGSKKTRHGRYIVESDT